MPNAPDMPGHSRRRLREMESPDDTSPTSPDKITRRSERIGDISTTRRLLEFGVTVYFTLSRGGMLSRNDAECMRTRGRGRTRANERHEDVEALRRRDVSCI